VATILTALSPTITDLQRRTAAERARLGKVKLQLQRDWAATKKMDPQRAAQLQASLRVQIHANSVARTDYNAMAQQVADAINDAKITSDQSVQLTRLHDAATAVLANPESTSGERVQATTILDAVASRRPFGLQMERAAQTAQDLGLPSIGQLETLVVIVAAAIIIPPVVRMLSARHA